MASVLQLRVFLAGRVAVENGDVLIDERLFPGRQGRLVFAYLIVHQGRPVPRDELAEALWGEALPSTWEKALTVIASKLRSLLTESGVDGASALTGAFGCYRLELPDGAWVDVAAASRATQVAEDALGSGDTDTAKREATLAESLLRRPFLPGDDGTWVEETRRDLDCVRVRAMIVLADTSLRLGETSEAAKWAEQVTTLEPFRETGYRRLMDAHVAAGNRAEALRVYERCRRLLADELGAYPSPETDSVYRGLLEGPSVRTAASLAVARPPPEVPRLADLENATSQRGVSVGGPRPLRGRRTFLVLAVLAALGVIGVVAVVLEVSPSRSHRVTAALVAADSLGVFEASGHALADTAVGTGPHGVAVGAGSVWVTNTNDNSVSRIDPKTNAVVQTIDVPDGPEGVAVGGGFVWVADSLANAVSQIDPGTNTVVRSIPVGNGPSDVAFGLGDVWVTDSADRTLVQLDPVTGRASAPLTVEAGADGVAVGFGSVWVTSGSSPGSVARIDPETDVAVKISVGDDPSAIAVGAGAVWVANGEEGTVSRIDASSNRPTGLITVGAGPAGIAASARAIWVSNELGGTLSKLDPATGRVVRTVETGNRPLGLAQTEGGLYVAVRTYGSAHRGGTLRILAPSLTFLGRLDPANVYHLEADQILTMTNDGLTAYRRTGGSDGLQLVPDLATSLPAPTDGGRTYTFQLRHGIRYSTGNLVRPADFRHAIERSLADVNGPGRLFFGGIIGASACTSQQCDLAGGIDADAATNSVTFHLAEPDPNFLYKLAEQSAYAVPASTPLKVPAQKPLPATGPYMLVHVDLAHRIRLIRNPYFHEWSAAAQPPGFPDEIDFKLQGDPHGGGTWQAQEVRAVERGHGDLVLEGVPNSHVREVETRFAAQAHPYRQIDTDYFPLNPRVPPFDDVRVRQALNYALDRRRLAALASPPALPTCQLLPPGLFGYRRYCSYTRNPQPDGRYSGPDLEKAKRLVAASGTAGQTVTIWAYASNPFRRAQGAYVASVLRQLGYRAHLRFTKKLFDELNKPRNKIQLTLNAGWLADYPSPINFFGFLLSCAAARAPNTNNYGRFCDPRLDAQMKRADSMQTSDPRRAEALWHTIDREVADQAPMVFLENERGLDFVSRRVGNYQYNPQWHVLLDQLWVR